MTYDSDMRNIKLIDVNAKAKINNRSNKENLKSLFTNISKIVIPTEIKGDFIDFAEYIITFTTNKLFEKKSIVVIDEIVKEGEILAAISPNGFTYTVDNLTNTIIFSNTSKDIVKNTKLTFYIFLDLRLIPKGRTIENFSTINGIKTNVAILKLGFAFQATKIDSVKKQPLQGAKFQLTNIFGMVIGTLTSDEKGIITSSIPNEGKYTLQEIEAPNGYMLNSKPISFNISLDDIGTVKDIGYIENYLFKINEPRYQINIQKVDDENELKKLNGAGYQVYAIDIVPNKLVASITTNEEGVAIINLPIGKYKLVEILAPIGYVKSEIDIVFEITAQS